VCTEKVFDSTIKPSDNKKRQAKCSRRQGRINLTALGGNKIVTRLPVVPGDDDCVWAEHRVGLRALLGKCLWQLYNSAKSHQRLEASARRLRKEGREKGTEDANGEGNCQRFDRQK